jgi:hypothetical protein
VIFAVLCPCMYILLAMEYTSNGYHTVNFGYYSAEFKTDAE